METNRAAMKFFFLFFFFLSKRDKTIWIDNQIKQATHVVAYFLLLLLGTYPF